MALGEQAELIVSLGLKDNLSSGLAGIKKNIGGLDQSFGRTQAALGQVGQQMKTVALVSTGALVGGMTLAIREAANFESQLNTINTVAKVSQEDLAGIGDSLRQMARDSGAPLEDLTASYYDLVSAGVDASNAQYVLTEANKLAVGGLASTSEAVDLVTTAMNSYGYSTDEVTEITNFFAQAIGAGKLTAAELAESFANIGPVAASAGIELEEVAAAYAQMTAAGTPAAQAATQMRAAIVALQTPNAALLKMQKDLNVNFADVAEEEGLAAAYQLIAEKADAQGISLTTLTGSVEASGYALAVSGDNAEGFATNLDLVKASTEGAGVAAGQAEERQKGLNFQMERLKATGRDVAIMFGEKMLPSITRIVTKLGEMIDLNYGKLERFADNVGDAFDQVFSDKNIEDGIAGINRKIGNLLDTIGERDIGKDLSGFLDFMKDLPWDTISSGMQITGEAARKAIDAFKSLPPGVQQGLITFLAANKLTGGLAGSLLSDIGSLILKSLTTITAGNVTLVAANVTGGVPGVPGGGKPNVPVNPIPALVVGGAAMVGLADSLGQISAYGDENNRLADLGLTQLEINALRLEQLKGSNIANRGVILQGNMDANARAANLQSAMDKIGGAAVPIVPKLATIFDRIGTTNTTLGTANAKLTGLGTLGTDHRMELQKIAQRAQEQKTLTQIGNHAASEAKDRLASIQISAQRTAAKDFSVTVNTHTTLQVSAYKIAEALNHSKVLNGGQ